MDYSDCPRMDMFLSGSERKIAVQIDGQKWILKFQYRDELKVRFNHVSEYLGSRIFSSLGFDVQTTELGTYRGEQVVACRNFIPDGCAFVPFNDVGESTLERDKELFQYSYEDIMAMLDANTKLTDVKETISTFWNIFIVDAFIGNFDRHGSNWGFLKCNGRYRLAPVFDNGSCLYPQMTDEDMMARIIDSRELTEDRVYRFPTSQIKMDGRKSSYYDVILGMRYAECNEALARVFPRIDLDEIHGIVDSIDSITDVHKRFYRHMIDSRYHLILEEAYGRLAD